MDLNTRDVKFRGKAAHVETIFDVKFKPSDACVLATAAYDSCIKVRDIL
jgi:hypothetical protein